MNQSLKGRGDDQLNSAERKTVLVADDEKSVRDILKLHLENGGYNVMLSENGDEAIKVLKNYNVSVAITDIKMPKIDGFGVLDFVKNHCIHVPVIMLTGYVDVETAMEAMKKGSIDYLTKPIRKKDLLDAIEYALKRKDPSNVPEPFEPNEIYLLKDDGIVIYHKGIRRPSELDFDIFGSMLTAIKIFIRDSFRQDGGELRAIELGRFKILVEEGDKFFLVVIGQGDGISNTREKVRDMTQKIHRNYGKMISNWDGTIDIFNGIKSEFEDLLGSGID